MESTELTVRLIILFVPGIIETFIYGICQNKNDINNRDYVINVVLSSFVMYSITYVFLKLAGGESTFLDALLDSSVKINMTEVLLASGLSVVCGIVEARMIRNMFLVSRKRNEKNKKVRISVWDDLFDDDAGSDDHVRVILKEQGVIYDGYVEKYTASLSGKKELTLKDAVKYDLESGKELQRGIKGVYVQIRDDEDVIIELL